MQSLSFSFLASRAVWYQGQTLIVVLMNPQEPTSAPPATAGVHSCAWPILEGAGVPVGVAP